MIVSHEHRFIFLKTKKTAGTSIDEAKRTPGAEPRNWRLHGWWKSPRSFLERRWFKFTAQDYGFYNHMPASEIVAILGETVWRSYFKFAFDRNPWDRQVSFYHHRYRREAKPPPFKTFLRKDRRARVNNYEIYSLDGAVAVDFLGRFENLDKDLKRALDSVGLKLERELPRAKATFRGSDSPYQDYYDEEARDIVGDWYRREIDLLGYRF